MRLLDKKITWGIALCSLLFSAITIKAQSVAPGYQSDGKRINSIYTSVPFLLITPDARSGGMGETGVATSADANTIYWNPAKLSFSEEEKEFSLSYTPWLRSLITDINLSNLSYSQRLNDIEAIGASMKYFSLGEISMSDADANSFGSYRPSELAIDVAYARKLSDNFSLGLAFRYIYSNIARGGVLMNSYQTKAVSTFAGDVSAYYKKGTQIFGQDAELAFGLNISNLSNKVTYQKGNIKYYLPANMRLGTATTLYTNSGKFTFALDFNKLLVPTSPIRDALGNVISGRETDRAVLSGIFGSFTDAPGGIGEELKEINYSVGAEYWVKNQFALRAGYFFEDQTKGGRKYFSSGIGANYKGRVKMDLAYIIANKQKTPLAQTLRISIGLSINKSDRYKSNSAFKNPGFTKSPYYVKQKSNKKNREEVINASL